MTMHLDSYLPSFSLKEFFVTQFVDNLEQHLSLSDRQESSRGMISGYQAFFASVSMKNLNLEMKIDDWSPLRRSQFPKFN